jgi:hypothetical protein
MTDMEEPRDVRQASWLLFALAAVATLGALSSTLSLLHLVGARDDLYAQKVGGEEAYQTVAHVLSDLRYQLVVALATAAFGLYYGIIVRRPWPRVRIWIWVLSVPLFLAWSCGLAQSTEVTVERGSPAFPDLQAAYRNLLPGWYAGVIGLITFLVLPLLALVTIWLLRSGASEYYQWAAARRYQERSGTGGAGPTLG